MSIVVRYPVVGLTRQRYDEATRQLDGAGVVWPPDGLQLHVLFGTEGELKVSEIWESAEQHQAFSIRPCRYSTRLESSWGASRRSSGFSSSRCRRRLPSTTRRSAAVEGRRTQRRCSRPPAPAACFVQHDGGGVGHVPTMPPERCLRSRRSEGSPTVGRSSARRRSPSAPSIRRSVSGRRGCRAAPHVRRLWRRRGRSQPAGRAGCTAGAGAASKVAGVAGAVPVLGPAGQR